VQKNLAILASSSVERQEAGVDGERFLLGNLHSQIDTTATH
jgi:hypothetical protein